VADRFTGCFAKARGFVNLWYGRKKRLAGLSIGQVWTPKST
jgi:preprotein translocase subunit SecD